MDYHDLEQAIKTWHGFFVEMSPPVYVGQSPVPSVLAIYKKCEACKLVVFDLNTEQDFLSASDFPQQRQFSPEELLQATLMLDLSGICKPNFFQNIDRQQVIEDTPACRWKLKQNEHAHPEWAANSLLAKNKNKVILGSFALLYQGLIM